MDKEISTGHANFSTLNPVFQLPIPNINSIKIYYEDGTEEIMNVELDEDGKCGLRFSKPVKEIHVLSPYENSKL